MTEQQVFLELSKKGVTIEQLQRIQRQYQQGNQGYNQTGSNYDPANNNVRVSEEDSSYPISIQPIQSDTIPQKNKIFGQNFFSTGSLTFEPNMKLPTPANYVLGPGDEVIIDVWGDSELNIRYTVTPDGYITVPGIGRIQLNGMRIDQATSRIKGAFSSIYSDLDSPQPRTFLAISLGNLRSIQVNVMGEVRMPGTYTLSSFATVFHALYAAGGINDIGSIRNIRVFRNGNVIATVDIYEYMMKGNNTGDITLRDGDIIKVDPYTILAQIVGEVKRPMKYEMRTHETLADLLTFAGGLTGNAYKTNVQVDRKGKIEMESFTVTESNFELFNLHDADSITVGNILDKISNSVSINGAVNRPGNYAIGNQIKTVCELIAIAGGTTGDAFLYRILLERENDDLTRSMQSIDLDALMNNRTADIVLKKNDRLFIPSVHNLDEDKTIYVGGEVQEPGTFPYANNMSVEDAILRARGLTESASTARIDVYRRIKDPVSTIPSNVTSQSFSFSLKDGLLISGDKSFTLQPFDQVVVRRSPGYEVQQNITVEGEVLFGGQYAKLQRDERLSSFIKRAGGITEQAYVKGARLARLLSGTERKRTEEALITRSRVQKDSTFLLDSLDFDIQYVGIDLEKALKNPGGPDDIILREGDVLTVPYYNGTVKISGGVMYPNTVTYNKRMSLDSYVRQAGGYSRLAMKSKPFVIYMNGKVASGRWAKIEPGCEIVVPEKPDREAMSVQGLLGISTSVASLALLILNIIK